jgi:hypothetical protein
MRCTDRIEMPATLAIVLTAPLLFNNLIPSVPSAQTICYSPHVDQQIASVN